MDEQIREALMNAILAEFKNLDELETGSEEKKAVIDDLTKLYKLRLEETKADTDYDEKYHRREMDTDRDKFDRAMKEREINNKAIADSNDEVEKNIQLKEQRKDRYIKLGVDAAAIVLPLIFYGTWMKRGFKFEETGTFTSTTFRGLFNQFKPKK